MKSYKINSTTIRNISYREKKKRLIIEFMSWGVYEYKKVPKHIIKSFTKASSIGSFFKDNIRNTYHYRKIADHASTDPSTPIHKNRRHPSEASPIFYKH